MTTKQAAAALGFAFVAAWVAFGFGDAILCLIGAALFAAIAATWRGELDLEDLRDSLGDLGTARHRPDQTTRQPQKGAP